jgi:fumarate hydratase subunit beta
MSAYIALETPLSESEAVKLRAGDMVKISGLVYTGRDAAHKRLCALIAENKELPIPLKDQIIYYVGPAPAKPGWVIGPAGPTSSYRMNPYAPLLLDRGLRGMIGKGKIGSEVIEALKRNHAVYFGATGGAAALISRSIVEAKVIAYKDLGPEAIRLFRVVDFPATVIVDTQGNNLYETGPAKYRL